MISKLILLFVLLFSIEFLTGNLDSDMLALAVPVVDFTVLVLSRHHMHDTGNCFIRKAIFEALVLQKFEVLLAVIIEEKCRSCMCYLRSDLTYPHTSVLEGFVDEVRELDR